MRNVQPSSQFTQWAKGYGSSVHPIQPILDKIRIRLAAVGVADPVEIPFGSRNDFGANGPDGIDKTFLKALGVEQQKSNRKYRNT